ncbi:MAG: Ku protein [Alphaproteobacteria bacterium]|nr:Ku protein [Alphaproteobacteria bacterium]
MPPPRAFWKGYLKLSLVTCPVAMLPATSEAAKVSFHTLNRKTGNRVQIRYADAETGKPVASEDQIKGYERAEGEYVMLEDEELDAVALDSTRTIDIDMFVPADAVDWIWYDTPHYLIPEEKVAEEAFAVIREAMAVTRTRAVSRLVLYNRERAVLIEPRGKGMVLWTLRYGDEVRDEAAYFGGIKAKRAAADAKKRIRQLIADRVRKWSPALAKDPVQQALQQMIAAKRKPERAGKKPSRRPHGDNVVDLMAALRKSLQGDARH